MGVFIKNKPVHFILIAILCVAIKSNAQNNIPDNITAAYNNYVQNTIEEKVYAHIDKSIYVSGELIWFKLYITDAELHKPLSLSKIGYAELLDSNNNPVLQGKIALKDGEGNGSFIIPVNIPSGNYYFRAYTNWMKNFSPDFYFRKRITIFNTRDLNKRSDTLAKIRYTINFFPEGGNMINTIPGRVAFKATDMNGQGTDFTGYVINERNDTAASFKPSKFGMGNFVFSPSSAHTYKTVINFPGQNSIVKDLPPISTAGYSMKVDRENTQLRIAVRTTETGEVYLIGHTGGTIKVAQAANPDNGSVKFLIDIDKLSAGISTFTLFNSDKKPVCERLYFKYPSNQLKLELTPDQTIYDLRKKMSIAISSKNELGKFIPASMSVAVFRIDSLQKPESMDISNYLWLSSDISTNVESPEYYFGNEPDSLKEEAMDNLMLTEGWRRFKWENIRAAAKPSFKYAPEYYGHQLTGKVTDSRTNSAAAGITAYLSVPGTKSLFQNSTSDSAGTVKFEFKNFYGNEIIAQTNAVTDSNYNVEINSPYSINYYQQKLSTFAVPDKFPNTLFEHISSGQVQHIYTGERQNSFNPFSIPDTLPFYQKPDVRYALDSYTRFTSMEELFREFVRNIFVTKPRGKFKLAMYEEEAQRTMDGSPLVLLDGVPIFKTEKVMAYDPLNIRAMDVVAHRYYMGNSMYEGVLNMVTYDGNLKDYELDRNAIVLDYEGLQLQREFYSPDYSTKEKIASRLPDFRNLLYWSPTVKTTSAGTQNISFYTSDLGGKYIAVIQGITRDGRSGSSTVTFEVKAPE